MILFAAFNVYLQSNETVIGHWEGVVSREGKNWRTWIDIQNDEAWGFLRLVVRYQELMVDWAKKMIDRIK